MPSTIQKQGHFYLPLIDISPYTADPTSLESKKVVEDVRHACISTGFFQLVGHGVSPELQAAVFEAAAKFFALPMDVKEPLAAKKNPGFRGYDLMASQSYETGILADLKEGYIYGTDFKADDPSVKAKRFFSGPNVYPTDSQLPASEFKVPIQKYYAAMMQLLNVVLDLVASSLGYGPDVFTEFKSNNPACPLRLLHYPPTRSTDPNKVQLGASAHSDFGAITLLLQDEHEGLEVLNKDNGEWVGVKPNKNAYVVNMGDMMKKMTDGLYESSVHRVINKNPTDRYSVVFFLDGNLDCKLKPLDSDKAHENVMTVEEWMFDRMNFSYGRHDTKAVTA